MHRNDEDEENLEDILTTNNTDLGGGLIIKEIDMYGLLIARVFLRFFIYFIFQTTCKEKN